MSRRDERQRTRRTKVLNAEKEGRGALSNVSVSNEEKRMEGRDKRQQQLVLFFVLPAGKYVAALSVNGLLLIHTEDLISSEYIAVQWSKQDMPRLVLLQSGTPLSCTGSVPRFPSRAAPPVSRK
ncbi:unnamed protein product [Calypogeia fissa]